MNELAERVARLVVVPVRLPGDYRRFEEIRRAVAEDGVGGLLLFGGDLDLAPRFLRRLREAAERPLLVMSDVERGVGQQVEGCMRHPPPMAVGALRDASAAYALGAATALECRRAGIDMALAPVLDLYNEPRNPIVGPRSFGEDPELEGKVGLLWLGEEYAQLDPSFCSWSRSGGEADCSPEDLNRSAFIAWIDCRL